jgi:hypothetical protein
MASSSASGLVSVRTDYVVEGCGLMLQIFLSDGMNANNVNRPD